MRTQRREFQIRIQGPGGGFSDDGDLLLCKNYRTAKAAQKAYPRVVKTFFKDNPAEKDSLYHVEIVEVLVQQAIEGASV